MRKIAFWIPLACTISCLCGLLFSIAQQNLRIGANDPQIQMAEDTARNLSSGTERTFVQKSVDIAQSLSPFIMVFDGQGKLMSTEAHMHGVIPQVPPGVFMYAKQDDEDRITWEPAPGVRIAAVIVPYRNGYVLAGRNLREVEKREDILFKQIIAGWVATLGIALLATLLFIPKK